MPEAIEAGGHRAPWIQRMKELGLGVKLAVDDNDVPAGACAEIGAP